MEEINYKISSCIKKSYTYFLPSSFLKRKIEKDLDTLAISDDPMENYLEIQRVGYEYLRGLDMGRNSLFAILTLASFGYYGVGLAKAVSDFSAISAPVVKDIAQLVEKPLRFLADKAPYAFPEYDKAGHLAVGLLIGRAVEALSSKILEHVYKGRDVDDIAAEKNKTYAFHTVTQLLATGMWALNKEYLDALLGGVKSIYDVVATLGGQFVNAVMSYSLANKYSVVINAMRKRLYELGMDDDGNPLPQEKKFKEVKVPIMKVREVKKAVKKRKPMPALPSSR